MPDGNYSGTDTFTYTTVTATGTKIFTVVVTVNPVADAPDLPHGSNTDHVANAAVSTLEDTNVALGLKLPVITDSVDGNGAHDAGDEATAGDHPERLGAITLTLSGAGADAGATLVKADGTALLASGGSYTIVIVTAGTTADTALHISSGLPTANVNYLTEAEYEGLMAKPAAHRHENFQVDVSATSYEVDDSGVPLTGVAGATSNQEITVYVQAVTDDAQLRFNGAAAASVANVDAVVYNGDNTVADVILKEDTTFNVKSILSAAFQDLDGSEARSITVTNGSGAAILVGGSQLAAGASRTIQARSGSNGQTGDIDSFNNITVGPIGNFSGDLNGIGIRINAQDGDGDGYNSSNADTAVDGVAEADTANNSVTLNLHVKPIAGDVTAGPVTTAEDTSVAFLKDLKVTDTGTTFGTEVIDAVSFVMPDGWLLSKQPAAAAGVWSIAGVGSAADPYVISFGSGTQAQREALLAQFEVTPPPHSSKNQDILLKVTTTDSNGSDSHQVVDKPLTVAITVTPVAEKAGVDSGGVAGGDVTINPDYDYKTPGKEDEWFDLGVEVDGGATFRLGDSWSNEDADEYTFARLTPELLTGDGSQANAIGSMFRYQDGEGAWHEFTYAGTPSNIWVPMQYLSSLQFKAALNFSGSFRILVEAVTIDYDDDAEPSASPWNPADPNTSTSPEDHGGASVAVSGGAWLTNIVIEPVADDITLSLNGHAIGREDTVIDLAVRAVSSDTSESITVVIRDIPVGATIFYVESDGSPGTFTATAGNTELSLADFNGAASGHHPRLPLKFQAPPHASGEFTLNITAQSTEPDLNGNPAEIYHLPVKVTVEGVADKAVVTLPPTTPTFAEADLDAVNGHIRLDQLVTSVGTEDTDTSEVVTVRISGLPEGFSLTGATLMKTGSGTERIWTLHAKDLAHVKIETPDNFSGSVTFQVAGVTTEAGARGGDSLTSAPVDVSFVVTPSPEAVTTTSATLVEDEITPLGFKLVAQNGDTDESLGNVYIPVAYGSTFTLYLGTTALSAAGLATELRGGALHYVISAGQAGTLAAKGSEHLDGVLGGFDFLYEVIDAHYGTAPSGSSVTELKSGRFELAATPVTDPVTVSIELITGTAATTIVSDDHAGDDATPDTATLSAADTVTVGLRVNSIDNDGSEHLIRVLIDNVPVGVTVIGAQQIDTHSWVLVYEGADARAIGVGGIGLPVEFEIGADAAGLDRAIRMTVQSKDRGDRDEATLIVEDSVEWHLVTTYAGGTPPTPPVISEWAYNDAAVSEDLQFQLADLITASVAIAEAARSNTLTITLADVPAGTEIEGMTRTLRGGNEIWTASVTVKPGEDGQVALRDLLESILITAPEHSNQNNDPGGFSFSATLSASVAGGGSNVRTIAGEEMVIPVQPVTDPAVITLTAADIDEGAAHIAVDLSVGTGPDGAHGEVLGGVAYVKVDAGGGVNAGSLVFANGDALATTSIGGDIYYIVPVGVGGGSANLIYVPAEGSTLQPGAVTFTALANTQEHNAAGPESATRSATANIAIINNGVTVNSNPVTGEEVAEADRSHAIELTGAGGLSVTLNDDDGTETINAILLSGLPIGFLVYAGSSAGDASLAALSNNAGGDGITNTWVLSSGGGLPSYVGILPPAHWSGTLSDLRLIVESGEGTLEQKLTETSDPLGPILVTAKADGLTLNPTHAFGKEGSIIALNLNAAMRDPELAAATLADESTETTTLRFSGLGDHAEFFVGGVQLDTSAGSGRTLSQDVDGSWVLTGLTQGDLNNLGFKQARAALVDQAPTAGLQVKVQAWTVESDNQQASTPVVEQFITLNISNQLVTNGADTLIWTGQAINGRGGDDTVQLRFQEELPGTELLARLKNIEVLDLSTKGENAITGLTAADVLGITDNRNALTIKGDGEDSVTLDSGWVRGSDVAMGGDIYHAYASAGATLHIQEQVQVQLIE